MEKTQQCGLRWVLESHGGDASEPLPRHMGTLLHAAAEAVAQTPDADPADLMRRVVDEHFDRLPFEAPWQAEQERRRVDGAVERFAAWLRDNKRELLAAERSFRVRLELGPPGVEVVMSGQVDRLERDDDGRVYVVDLKTGKHTPSRKDAEQHAQMGAYQLAVTHGAFPEGTDAGGAELVYPSVANKTPKTLAQGPLADAANPQWAAEMVDDTARQMSAAAFEARHSSKCATCSVRNCCPLAEEGRQVTDD